MNDDFIEFVSLLAGNNVDFVIVGAHALGFHGIPRFTGDIDILVYPSEENAKKILKAVSDFFGSTLGLSEKDMSDDDTIQFGRPPVRIDLLKKVTGVTLDEIWSTRVRGRFGSTDVFYISREMMIRNKLATGRDKDVLDVKMLRDEQ